MNAEQLGKRLEDIREERLPLPAGGRTKERHRRLFAIGHENLSLAKLAEAHWDAVAILDEAGRAPAPGALYAVWASEIPGKALQLKGNTVSGTKMFASGATLVDRTLVTVGAPTQQLVEINLRSNEDHYAVDLSAWATQAFQLTRTGTITFHAADLEPDALIGPPGWYLDRPGFWHGACGPAACWAGGVTGLVNYATESNREDPHTLAHLGAMQANLWALEAFLDRAGEQADAAPQDRAAAQRRAFTVRHLVEQTCTDTLRRFARAYGPYPLAMREDTALRYQEADLFLRQSHGERDLEALARLTKQD